MKGQFAIVFGFVLAIVYIVSSGDRRSSGGANNSKSPSRGGWSVSQLSNLSEFRQPDPSISIATVWGRKISLAKRDSLCVFGPTQSFKTSRLAIPAIVQFREGSAVISSVKSDLFEATHLNRERYGLVYVFDPFGTSSHGNCQFDPIALSGDPLSRRRIATLITSNMAVSGGTSESKFWATLAARLLESLLHAAFVGGRSLVELMTWVEEGSFEQPRQLLKSEGEQISLARLLAIFSEDEKIVSSTVTTLEAYLEPFHMMRFSNDGEAVNLATLDPSVESMTIYLIAPPTRQVEAGQLFATLLSTIFDKIYANQGSTRTLFVFDEAANLAPVANLDEVVSTIASFGGQVISIYQDFAQLSHRYHDSAMSIVNNHRAKLFLGGISDPLTINLASQISGVNRQVKSNRIKADRDRGDKLLANGELRSLSPGYGLLIYGHRPALIVRMLAK
ncbi:MAG: type IV secretory system conjugative DNA transfer family protein [Actinomycetota bacterium]|nr:type IV secretory system conjugative DNA transfer family protein [Actinomycetota bacterium]